MKRALFVVLLTVAGCQWLPGTDAHRVETAKALVREELIDPSSAQFEDVVVSKALGGEPAMVCGWVNARNRLGGFVGAEQFVVAEGRVRALGGRVDEGWVGKMGACVAGNEKASARLMRDVDRSLDAYGAAVKSAD